MNSRSQVSPQTSQSELKAILSASLQEPDFPYSHGQHCGCCLHKQGRGYEFSAVMSQSVTRIALHKNYVHPPGGWIYYFCFFRRPMSDVRCPMSGVRRPMSGVTHGFRSFKGKVLELLSPNLVCRLIGSVACLGLLLAVVPLLLTE